MIKILYVITKSNWGGAQRYVYDLATSLDKEKFEVVVAAGSDGTVGAGDSGALIEQLSAAGIRTIYIPFLQRDINIIKEFLSLFALIKIFKRERPNVIHLNSAKIGGLGAIAAYSLRLPAGKAGLYGLRPKILFTAHGWGFNEDRPYIARVIIFFAQWIATLFCDVVVCVSYAVFHQGLYFPFVSKKLRLINLGITTAPFFNRTQAKHKIAAVSKTLSAHGGFPWIGCIAELTKNKGLTYLIQAASKLPPPAGGSSFRLLIIGGGEDYQNLKAQISKLKLEDNVFLLGFLPEAAKYLKAFDIFVLPSFTEAGAYVLHEAGLAGLPVVATKVGGIPWIIKDGESGFLVPPKNPGALAEALKKLLDNEDLRKQMGRKNRQIISQKFSFEKMLKETIDIYDGG